MPVLCLLSRLSAAIAWSTALLSSCGALQAAVADLALKCDEAAAIAARETDVPLDVLRAISLTETGRARNGVVRPWPWTVNMEGTGAWFDTEEDARAYVYRHYKRGARSFDVGCFQLNFKWHGENFASIEEMFQPLANARYAAQFLKSLHEELGEWSAAAGAYHSRTPKYAKRYRQRFDRLRAGLEDAPAVSAPSAAETPMPVATGPRSPLPGLAEAAVPRLGSLVPLSPAADG